MTLFKSYAFTIMTTLASLSLCDSASEYKTTQQLQRIDDSTKTMSNNYDKNGIQPPDLHKRAEWRMLNVSPRTGILVATTAAWMGLSVLTGGGVQIAGVVLGAVWAAAAAILAHYDENSGSISSKRNLALGLYNKAIDDGSKISTKHGLMYDLRSLLDNDLEKRSQELQEIYNILDDGGMNGVVLIKREIYKNIVNASLFEQLKDHFLWVYENGTATIAVGADHLSNHEMAQRIALALPGEPYNSAENNSTNDVRSNTFPADWISYNFDNVNHDLAKSWWIDNMRYTPNYEALLGDYMDHGEIYFNTYGGVDSQCNDDHDGAQMP